jgi:transglutaminase-like putative cysteine protease
VTFGRQKRLLLGLLAFLAPLPLPFNDVVVWPVLLAYLIGVALFLRRAWNDPPRWLPTWAMNVLGLVYIPVFFLDLLVLSRGRLVQPVLHLCLYTLLVKLYSLVRERDKWQAAIGIFFLFLGGMGTSVHPLIVLYLIGFLILSLVMLTRFAFLHVLAGFGREDPALARIPLGGFLTVSTVLTVVLAVPLFAVLPRVRSPYIVGRSLGGSSQMESAGFSDEVTLDSIGQIRSSREVALRLLEEGALDPDREIRFKAATYDVYQGGTWRRAPTRAVLQRERVQFLLSRSQKPARWIKIWLQPLRSRSMPLPVEAVAVEPRTPVLEVDEGGAVSFSFNPLEVREYRVGLTDRPVLLGIDPAGTASDPTLDPRGVTPRIAGLARQVMGTTDSVGERVRRLETYLIKNYEYTLDFDGRSAANPIEDFLFRYRSGQCEYFASSMVLMLRSQGISARLVTGFLGGEYNPFEGYFIVRGSNAHAWVEAYLPGVGWHIYDPTPPAGRPTADAGGSWALARQAWDFVLFRWDRYVLTYGLYDQLRIFSSLHNVWTDFWKIFERKDKSGEPAEANPDTVSVTQGLEEDKPSSPLDVPLPAALALTLLAAAVYALYLRFRPPLTATAAYRQLRRRLGRSGAPVPDWVPPQRLHREAGARYPAAAAPMGRVIDFYLRESFGGQALRDEEREALKAALDEAERGVRERPSAQARRQAG